MKIFVTGGSGFVGGHVIRKLIAEGNTLVAPARREESCVAIRALGASSSMLNYADQAAVGMAMDGCDAVVHIAAHLRMWGPWSDFMSSNVELTDAVVRAAKKRGVRRFVHIGAASVIMQAAAPIVQADESAPLTALRHLPYSATKALAEAHVLAAYAQGFRPVVLRPPFIWGPGDMVDGELGDQVRRGQFAWIAKGDYPYATCHVYNLCHAISLALKSEVTGAYFVTDDEKTSLRDFMIRRLIAAGLRPPRLSVPARLAWLAGWIMEKLWSTGRIGGDPPLTRELVRLIGYPFTLDISRAKAELGYSPQINISRGMDTCVR